MFRTVFLGTRHEFGERYPAENVEVVATMPVVYSSWVTISMVRNGPLAESPSFCKYNMHKSNFGLVARRCRQSSWFFWVREWHSHCFALPPSTDAMSYPTPNLYKIGLVQEVKSQSLLTSPVVVGQNPSLLVLIDIPPFLSISVHFYPFLSISWLAPPKKATHPEHVVSARFCVENMVGCLPIHNDPQSTINRYGQTGQNWTNWLCLKIGQAKSQWEIFRIQSMEVL